MSETCVVIGASHAAAQLVASLRQEGWEHDIIVIGDEQHLPYNHPPLSKAYLSGDQQAEALSIRKAAFFEQKNVQFRLGETVTAIHRQDKTVTLATGETIAYHKLALCTGSRVRPIDLPGVNLSGIHYLRTLADVDGIRADVKPGGTAVIVGGGYIGLETAASLTKLGMKVTVLEMAPRVLARVTAPEVSAFYTRVHNEEGVTIKTNTSVAAFNGNSRIESVASNDGSEYPADLVVIGVGVLPNVELAQDCGLSVDNGILVDDFACTSDPDIVAAGDVTNHFNSIYNIRLRLESVPNAVDQAKSAAASICGKEKVYSTLPWFWSDQFDLKLQIAGLSQGYDQVIIRGDHQTNRSFVAFYLRENKVIAADCVNRPVEFMTVKKSLSTGQPLAIDKLANDSIPAKELWA